MKDIVQYQALTFKSEVNQLDMQSTVCYKEAI